MNLSGLRSKACEMRKHKDSLFAGHLGEKEGELNADKEWEPSFKA